MKKLFLGLCLFVFTLMSYANDSSCTLPMNAKQIIGNNISGQPQLTCNNNLLSLELPASSTPTKYTILFPSDLFEDQHIFHGLAVLYNNSNPLILSSEKEVEYITLPQEKTFTQDNTWIGRKGRFTIFMISATNAQINFTEKHITVEWKANTPIKLQLYLGQPIEEFSSIRFSNLWSVFSVLCRIFESILVFLHSLLGNWGVAIIALAVVIKIILLPLSLLMQKYQREVSRCQSILEPKLKAIKAQYDGEEAHNRIMAEYKALNISPFYTLKPMISLFIQIPILVVVSNILGEMPEFVGQSFLWIKDLAYPDTIAHLPFSLPLFGNEFNLLPFLMALVTFLATYLFQNKHAPKGSVTRQKFSLYLMVTAFFVLFYPFPAALVLFWTMTNLLQGIQQQFLKL